MNTGKIAIVTGAGTGIGKSAVLALNQRGGMLFWPDAESSL
jgi:NAD(P)-dependent dehydrogenase (short-subunit alcohol dehydrogenase family)